MKSDTDNRSFVVLVLGSGEELLWVGAPDPARSVRRSWMTFAFGVVWMGFNVNFAVQWYAGPFHNVSGPFGLFGMQGGLSYLFEVPFFAIGIVMLCSPLYAYLLAAKTAYAITNQRILIVESLLSRKVRSYTPSQINVLERSERPDGTGDVTFARSYYRDSEGSRQKSDAEFVGIPNVREVENLIRATFAGDQIVDQSAPAPVDVNGAPSIGALANRFNLIETGGELTIRKKNAEASRSLRSSVGGGLGCAAIAGFFVGFFLFTGGWQTGFLSVRALIVGGLLLIAYSLWTAVESIVRSRFGSEEWHVREGAFTIRRTLFGRVSDKVIRNCVVKINKSTSNLPVLYSVYLWDEQYPLKVRCALVSNESSQQDTEGLAALVGRYTGWAVERREM